MDKSLASVVSSNLSALFCSLSTHNHDQVEYFTEEEIHNMIKKSVEEVSSKDKLKAISWSLSAVVLFVGKKFHDRVSGQGLSFP